MSEIKTPVQEAALAARKKTAREDLAVVFKDRIQDYDTWGTNGNKGKSFDDLVEEVAEGESTVQVEQGDSGQEVIRETHVAGGDIFCTVDGQRYRLVQEQTFTYFDGTKPKVETREKQASFSEKRKYKATDDPDAVPVHESAEETMQRGLREEIKGLDITDLQSNGEPVHRVENDANTGITYPGIRNRFDVTRYSFTLQAEKVILEDGKPKGYESAEPPKSYKDAIRTQKFVWKPVENK